MVSKRMSLRKRRRVRRRRPSPSNNIFRTKRSFFETFTVNYNGGTVNTFDAFDFKLNTLPSYTEFTNLYDSYRITKIKMHWLPRMNIFSFDAYTATSTESPQLLTVVDTDDSTVPSSLDELLERETMRVHHFSKPFTITFKPKFSLAAWGGTLFTSYAEGGANQWIDVLSPGVPYFGVKVGTTTYSTNNSGENPVWDIITTYYLEFKKVR